MSHVGETFKINGLTEFMKDKNLPFYFAVGAITILGIVKEVVESRYSLEATTPAGSKVKLRPDRAENMEGAGNLEEATREDAQDGETGD